MNSDSLSLADVDLGKLNVLLAYENVSAALWASELITELLQVDPGAPGVSFSPRSFGMLGDPSWIHSTAAKWVDADLVVIACTTDRMVLSRAVEKWLETLLGQYATDPIKPAVVAYFRAANVYDNSSSPRLQTVQRIAREAGCKFFAPFVSREEVEPVANIQPLQAEATHA
jgi:hypothetical protein